MNKLPLLLGNDTRDGVDTTRPVLLAINVASNNSSKDVQRQDDEEADGSNRYLTTPCRRKDGIYKIMAEN